MLCDEQWIERFHRKLSLFNFLLYLIVSKLCLVLFCILKNWQLLCAVGKDPQFVVLFPELKMKFHKRIRQVV